MRRILCKILGHKWIEADRIDVNAFWRMLYSHGCLRCNKVVKRKLDPLDERTISITKPERYKVGG